MSAPVVTWPVDAAPQGSDLVCPITNAPGNRSPEKLRAVLEQFDVTGAERYRRNHRCPPTNLCTWCNRFVSDATKALGCPIPHQKANDFQDWFEKKGPALGWSPCARADVKFHLEMGHPVVVNYWNPNGRGHVAMVVKPALGEHQANYAKGMLFFAQAGAINSLEVPEGWVFTKGTKVSFWSHI